MSWIVLVGSAVGAFMAAIGTASMGGPVEAVCVNYGVGMMLLAIGAAVYFGDDK